MKKVSLLLTAFIAVLFMACNKDMKVVKELDGTWKLTGYSENGVSDPDVASYNATYSFTKCKVKKEDCDGTFSIMGLAFPFKYKVTDKGTKMTITQTTNGTTDVTNATITEHSDSKVVLTYTQDGDTYVETLTK